MAEILLTGRPASPGLAIGPVTVLTGAVASRTAIGDPAQEAAALQAAIEAATAQIAELIATVQGEAADILEFQVAMLEDDALAEGAYDAISVGVAADHAWRSALDAEISGYRAAEDEYFRGPGRRSGRYPRPGARAPERRGHAREDYRRFDRRR